MQNCYYPLPVQAPLPAPKDDDAPMERLDKSRASSDEMRRPFMQLGAVSGAAGSAYVELGRTRVVCAVYGPRTDTRARREFSKDGQLVCDVKYAPFADKATRRERGQDPDEMELSAIVEEALAPAVMLHKLPKCIVSVFVTVLEDDGGVFAAAINCASLALADAAVEMYDVVTASSAGIVNGLVVLDPSREEEQRGDGKLALAYMPSVGRVTYMLQAGKIHHTQLQEAVDLCTDACTGVTQSLLTASLVQALS
ncbi:Exosome complex component MTR3 [Phytophthora pseudosyringae]|uniref:Exosome complex component MTR3 n=1 Tax=Phytophthora pseudosyringae TaxID=221518 RepID=A0A8T1VW72_9STRA|nr:Exosome complex component MTR3 [Phytophthora pseudosyringae]